MSSHGISRTEYRQNTEDHQSRGQELHRLSVYIDLVAKLQKKKNSSDYSHTALNLTSGVLKLNPEFYTIWNYRREILLQTSFRKTSLDTTTCNKIDKQLVEVEGLATEESQCVALLKGELGFLVPLLTTYPKCYWIWNHRLWTLRQSSVLLLPKTSNSFWNAELELVGMMLGRDMRNFHAWMYRRLVVAKIENQIQGEHQSLVKSEYEYTSRVVRGVGGMTNYSAWHQRSTLIPKLLEEKGAKAQERMDTLEDELGLLKRAIATDPEDQSLWFYHRWLVYSNTSSSDKSAISPGMPVSTRILILMEQIDQLNELLESHPSCKYILKALILYVSLLQNLRKEQPEEVIEVMGDIDEEAEIRKIKGWLKELVMIDPMRKCRYKALEDKIVPITSNNS